MKAHLIKNALNLQASEHTLPFFKAAPSINVFPTINCESARDPLGMTRWSEVVLNACTSMSHSLMDLNQGD